MIIKYLLIFCMVKNISNIVLTNHDIQNLNLYCKKDLVIECQYTSNLYLIFVIEIATLSTVKRDYLLYN